MANDLHPLQMDILNKLLFHPKSRYTDLRPNADVENNKLNFHLNQLQDLGLITKLDDRYDLTASGKEFAGRIDTDNLIIQKQAKISVSICCVREAGNAKEYLIYTRLKQPFYGCQGFISGKVSYGETVETTAHRELQEETGLLGEAKIAVLKHYHVFDQTSRELLEDTFRFFCLIENPTGELHQSDEGKYEWVKRADLPKYVTNHFESYAAFEEQLALVEDFSGEFQFIEEDHYSGKF